MKGTAIDAFLIKQVMIAAPKQGVKNMILKDKYPICEFDTGKDPIIQAANFLTESLPEI